MNSPGPILFMVILLVVLGASAATLRHQIYDIPWTPSGQALVWQVEARIEFTAQGGPSQVYLALPPNQSGFGLVQESAASSGWGFSIEPGEQRRAHWSQRNPSNRQVLFYKLDMVTNNDEVAAPPPPEVTPVTWDEPYQTAVDHLLNTVYPTSADAHTLTVQIIQALGRVPADQNLALLTANYGRQDMLVRVLQTVQVPARKVQVLVLEDGRRRQSLASYLQVWDGSRWRLYDPARGELTDTDNLLLWQTGEVAVLEVLGGANSRVTFSMISETHSSTVLAQQQADDLALSLYNLPIAEQGMFQLIMLLPVGAFVVTLLRVLVGLRTSGTFMPVLIALAFLQTDLLPGLAIFIIVVAIGLFIRSYLSTLNLLLVARIATLVVLVISIVSIVSIVSFRLGLIHGLTITFFPMIILAWTIERMSITWEEEGPKEVLIQGSSSLFVAVLAYLLMSVDLVEHLAFHFPELHLVLLGIILLLGRYTGYRLLELNGFAAFRTND